MEVMKPLDILTWNIENFPKNNNTVDTLSSIINDLYVDVIALQEIESNSSLNEIKIILEPIDRIPV